MFGLCVCILVLQVAIIMIIHRNRLAMRSDSVYIHKQERQHNMKYFFKCGSRHVVEEDSANQWHNIKFNNHVVGSIAKNIRHLILQQLLFDPFFFFLSWMPAGLTLYFNFGTLYYQVGKKKKNYREGNEWIIFFSTELQVRFSLFLHDVTYILSQPYGGAYLWKLDLSLN